MNEAKLFMQKALLRQRDNTVRKLKLQNILKHTGPTPGADTYQKSGTTHVGKLEKSLKRPFHMQPKTSRGKIYIVRWSVYIDKEAVALLPKIYGSNSGN